MVNLTLPNDTIAVSRLDFNGEEWNYIVLRKDDIVNNEQTYKVQWWSATMRFYWTKNNMSFTDALNRFYLKVKPNIPNIIKDLNESTNYIDYEDLYEKLIDKFKEFTQYIREKLHDFIKEEEEGFFNVEDVEELLEELN